MNAKYGWIAAVFCTSILLSGCGDSRDKAMSDMVEAMEETSKVLTDIKDEKSAKKAVPKLEELGERTKAIKKRVEELGEPSEEEQKQLEKKYKDRMMKAMKSMMMETIRISVDPKMREHIQKAMKDFSKP